MTGPHIEIHYADQWAALYVDGKLHTDPGDAYRVEEEAFALVGIKQVQDDAFMRGQDRREGVARTLDDVDEYRWQRDNRRSEAQRLRDEAARLTAEAARLEGGT